VFGIIAEQSIGRLFVAAIIPGLSQALFYMIAIWILCRINPLLGPATARAPWSERWRSLWRIMDMIGLIVLVIGGLTIGWFTPTEAASVGCVGAYVIAALRRKLTLRSVALSLWETLRTSGMIYAIVVGALIFSTFISVTGFADVLASAVNNPQFGALGVVLAMTAVILLLGMFLDGMAIMLLLTPIFLPIVFQFGLSPIWFGIFLVRTMEIGFITPPIGMNVFVIQSIAKDIPIGTVFKGVIPFILADFAHLALLIAFPALTLALPNWVDA
jgi:tripartite ATP-independent transporter DctM subunit